MKGTEPMKTADRLQASALAAAREDYRRRCADEESARVKKAQSFEGLKLSWKLMHGRWPLSADDFEDMICG